MEYHEYRFSSTAIIIQKYLEISRECTLFIGKLVVIMVWYNIVYSNVLLFSTVCVVYCICDVVARKMCNFKMRKFLSGIWQYWISLRALQTASLFVLW